MTRPVLRSNPAVYSPTACTERDLVRRRPAYALGDRENLAVEEAQYEQHADLPPEVTVSESRFAGGR